MGTSVVGLARSAVRWLAGIGLALACLGAPALAATLTVLVDPDNNPATGCSVGTPNGAFDGVGSRFITTVDTTQSPPRVTGITREDCTAAPGTFSAPVSVSSGGWPLGMGTGIGGANVIETGLPVGVPGPVRIGVIYADGAIGTDAVTVGIGGGPIVVASHVPGHVEPVPTLSDAMLAVLVLLMLAVGWKYGRHRFPAAPMAVVALVMVSMVAWAAIVLDGLIGDWAGIPQAASDPADTDGADIVAIFATIEGTTLFVRADVRTARPPVAVADSYTAVSGTPLAIVPPAGLLDNDDRGIPAATVASFGGGSLGGTVTTNAASGTALFGAGGSLTVNAAGGFTYTPAAGFTGPFTFSYRITSVNGSSDATVTINTQQAPAITSAAATTFNVGTAGSFTVTTTGFPAPTLAMSGTLPAGVTFTAGTGVLSGTPAAGSAGTYPLVFTATNGVAPNATQNFTLTVTQGVAITSAAATTFTVGTLGSFTVTTTASPVANSITFTGTLPAGVSFANNGDGTATLSGTPGAGTGGAYPITITAANGGVSTPGTQNFTLTVNQAPAITSVNAATFLVGTPGTHTLVATGFPAPTRSVTGALPNGVTFDTATGVLSGTPAAGTAGAYPLTFTAANGVGADATQVFTLTVQDGVLITSAASTTFLAGSANTFTVTTSGTPPATSVTAALPVIAGVTFTDNGATGTLAGNPGPGTGGVYNFNIAATNGVPPNASQPFTLTINEAPTITSANATTFQVGVPGTFTVIAQGFPAPTFTVTLGTLPTGVTLNPTTGALSGTPAGGTGGTYPVTITAANGIGTAATQVFTLTVNQAPAITSANAVTFTVGTLGSFTATATGFPAPAVAFSGVPGGLGVGAVGAVLSGTPLAGSGGIYNGLLVTASNGVGANATQPFTLTINEAPAITSANNASFQVGVAGTFTVIANGFPASSFTTGGPLPAGVTLAADGTLSGTPAAGSGGVYPFTITASNGVLPNGTQNFTLSVTDPPVAVADAFNTVHDTALNVAAAGVLANDNLGAPSATVTHFGGGSLGGVVTGNVAGATANFGASGALTVNANGSFAFTPDADFAGAFTFLYRITNTDGTSDATVTITVTNAAPIVDLNGPAAGIDFAATFIAGGAPVAIVDAAALTVTDTDDTHLTGATIQITNLANVGAETLAVTCPDAGPGCSGAILLAHVTYTAATGTLEILANAPLADYQALLRTLTYNNSLAIPTGPPRDITVVVNDGIVDSAVARTIVTTGNQAPTISVPGAQSTQVNTPLVFSAGNGNAITVADPDAGAADVEVTLTGANGTVTLATTAGLTSVTGNGTALVVATGPLAAQNAALAGLTFTPTTSFVSPPDASLKVDISDLGNTGPGGALTAPQATVLITVATSPTITSANATTFIIGQPGTFTVTTSAVPTVTTITRGGVALPANVTYADNGNGTATLAGTPASGTAGSYVFTFTASNGFPPDAVQNPFTLTIGKQDQTVSFTSAAPGAAAVGGATYNVTGTATSALPVAFTIDASASTVCSIAGATVSFIGAGTCVINVNQAGDADYNAAPQVQQSFAVAPGSQTITFTSAAPAAATFGGATYNVTATATSGLAVTFTIDASASAVCSIAGSTVSFIGAGTCVINANQAGNANYNAAPQVQQSFTVAKASQTISFTSVAPTTATVGGATYGVAATATSGLTVTFAIDASASAVCSIAGSTVSFIGAGTCVINANQAGNANYDPAPQVQQSFAVKIAQTISFTSTPPAMPTVGGATYTVTATATSALAVVFTIDAPAAGVCTVAGSTVTFTGGGTCVINANQPGDATYYAAPQVQQSFTVKSAQAITFTSAAPVAAVYLGSNYTVTATGGTSGNAVTFTIDASASTVCSIAGSTVSFIGTGTCVINANQLGGALHYDAPQVQQSFGVGPNLSGDAYNAVGHTQLVVDSHSAPSTPFTSAPTNILANDTSNVAITVTAVTGAATTRGGSITIDSAGKLTYTPPVETTQTPPADTYVYTGTSNGVSRTATITFNIANVVWYVNNTYAGANGASDGRSHRPFTTLDAASIPSLANSYIYVHTGSGNTTGNLTMDTGQELRGQGVAFTLGALSLAAGTRPTLTGTVTLADDTLITGANFVNASPAIQGNGFTATQAILVDQVNVTGGNNALSLTNVNGSITAGLTFSNAVISNTTGAEILVAGGNIPLTFPNTTTISGNSGRLIDIQNRTGNAVSFAGALTDSGTGILLNNNATSAFTFSGGMTLNGTGTTFTATNPALGGTLSIAGTNTIGATTPPTTAIALNVANINIAAGGLGFVRISSSGAANGIVLNNTGATAGLTVSGDAGSAANASGGTIQNSTGHGIALTNTRDIALDQMVVQSTGGSGINGTGVTNFSFTNGAISNSGNVLGESNIAFNGNGTGLGNNLAGTFTVTGSTLTNAFEGGIDVQNDSGTISLATITGNTITSSTDVNLSKGDGIQLIGIGGASAAANLTRADITNNTIRNFPSGGGIFVSYGNVNAAGPGGRAGTAGSLTDKITITNNTVRGASAANRFGTSAIVVGVSGGNSASRSQGNFDVSSNGTVLEPIGDSLGIVIGIGNNGYSTTTATINNNVIVANNTVGSSGIGGGNGVVLGQETPDLTLTVFNNSISQTDGNGILLVGRGNGNTTSGTQGIARFKIQNNTVAAPLAGVRPGIRVDAGNTAANTDDAICLNISGNTTGGSGGHDGIGLRKQGTSTTVHDFSVNGMAATGTPGVEQYVGNTGLNPGSATGTVGGVNGVLLLSATTGFSSCSLP